MWINGMIIMMISPRYGVVVKADIGKYANHADAS